MKTYSLFVKGKAVKIIFIVIKVERIIKKIDLYLLVLYNIKLFKILKSAL